MPGWNVFLITSWSPGPETAKDKQAVLELLAGRKDLPAAWVGGWVGRNWEVAGLGLRIGIGSGSALGFLRLQRSLSGSNLINYKWNGNTSKTKATAIPAISLQNASCVDCVCLLEWGKSVKTGTTRKHNEQQQVPPSPIRFFFLLAYGPTGKGLSVFQNNSGKIKGPAPPRLPSRAIKFFYAPGPQTIRC